MYGDNVLGEQYQLMLFLFAKVALSHSPHWELLELDWRILGWTIILLSRSIEYHYDLAGI